MSATPWMFRLYRVEGRHRARNVLVRVPADAEQRADPRSIEEHCLNVRDVVISEHMGAIPEECVITPLGEHVGPADGVTLNRDLTWSGLKLWLLRDERSEPPHLFLGEYEDEATLRRQARATGFSEECASAQEIEVLFSAGLDL